MRVLLFVLLTTQLQAQSIIGELWNSKSFWAGNTCAFIGGTADGTNQTVLFHYDRFKRAFPTANDQWANPQLSWVNKYNDPFFGKSTFLVGTTDLYHMSRSVDNLFTVTMMPLFATTSVDIFDKSIPKKVRWRHVKKKALEGVSHMVFRQVGFAL